LSLQQLTMGVEEEFFLVSADGRLAESSPEFADTPTTHGGFSAELRQCQVEAVTGVCRTTEQLLGQLTGLRRELAGLVGKHGLRLLASGSPVLRELEPAEITPTPRYLRIAEQFGDMVRSVPTCGCHVHVGIPDRETGVRVINQLRPWLPVLLAVSANSPFNGADTGYASWRYQEWSRWPSAGPPPLVSGADEYESIVDDMLRCGAVIDTAMVYWDIRLSQSHPTVEFRISDVAARPEHAALIATLIRGLVADALDATTPPSDQPQAVLRANIWRASRDGLNARTLHPVTGELTPIDSQLVDLVERLRPALGVDHDFVAAGLARLRALGDGAARQRATYRRRHALTDVVDDLTVHPHEHADRGLHHRLRSAQVIPEMPVIPRAS